MSFTTVKRVSKAFILACLVTTTLGAATAYADDDDYDDDDYEGWRKHGRTTQVVHVHHHYPKHGAKRWQNNQRRNGTQGVYQTAQRHGTGSGPFNIGSLIGVAAGGILGNQVGSGSGKILATVGGALLGGIVGNAVYQDITARDEAQINQALERTPTGRTVSWTNPDTGNRFEVQPTRTFKNSARQDCRDYKTWVFIDGYEKEVTGTACRNTNGQWVLVSQ